MNGEDDHIYWTFTGGKTDEINREWNSKADTLATLQYIPMKDDIINFKDWIECEEAREDDDGRENLLNDFGTTLFIVFQRELVIPDEYQIHKWFIYIKPYFLNQV